MNKREQRLFNVKYLLIKIYYDIISNKYKVPYIVLQCPFGIHISENHFNFLYKIMLSTSVCRSCVFASMFVVRMNWLFWRESEMIKDRYHFKDPMLSYKQLLNVLMLNWHDIEVSYSLLDVFQPLKWKSIIMIIFLTRIYNLWDINICSTMLLVLFCNIIYLASDIPPSIKCLYRKVSFINNNWLFRHQQTQHTPNCSLWFGFYY